jgi:peptide chain release factor subunit 1
LAERNSLLLYRLKRTLTTLSSKEGRHTELISLYITPDRQISDVMSSLRQEYSTASNIKSKSTRKNVMDAIERVMQRLRLFTKPPPNGLVLFCGAIPQNGEGSEKIEIYVIEPPEPTPIYYYRCNHRFHLEPLLEMLQAKSLYGLLVIDGKRATIATLRGKVLKTAKEVTSGIPGKHRAGGQSARRFERLREVEVKAYYKRVGEHANGLYLRLPDLKGIIIGGPGPTKYDFKRGDYLQYALKERVLATVDTSYTGDAGLKEVVDKSTDILREVRYIQERKVVQAFLYELGHDTGLVTYGEREVRKALQNGTVTTLLVSEDYEGVGVTLHCTNCGFSEQTTLKRDAASSVVENGAKQRCSQCATSNIEVTARDVIDELAELAEQTGAEVEVISALTEEGLQLRDGFGGVAALLRYKQG